MKKHKKLLALLLAAIMVMSTLLAGCGSNNDKTPDGGENNKQEDNTSDNNDSNTENESKEPRTVTVIGRDYTNSSRPWWGLEQYPEWHAGKLFDSKLEAIGVKMDIETLPCEQYSDMFKTRFASWLDMPDIINATPMPNSEIVAAGQSGKLWEVKELLDTYDEDGSIWEFMNTVAPNGMKMIGDENGDIWWFPYVCGDSVEGLSSTGYTFNIRKDWLDAVGEDYQQFYTPDELFDVLVKFREEDANGNGVADEVLHINLTGQWEPISAAFGMCQKYVGALSDGSGVMSKIDHENFPAFIEYCQKLYQAGVWSTEILNEDENILESNRASGDYIYSHATWQEKSVVGYEDTAAYAPLIIDDDGGANGFTMAQRDLPDACYSNFLVNKDCADPQAVADLLDYVYSEEGFQDMEFGVEGVTFEFDENGNRVVIDPNTRITEEDCSRSGLGEVIGNNLVPRVWWGVMSVEEWKANYGSTPYEEKNAFFDVLETANEKGYAFCPSTQPFAMMTTAESEAYNAVATDVETYISELITDLIIGEKSLDDLATYRAEVGEMGLDTMIEIRTAQYDRYMAME